MWKSRHLPFSLVFNFLCVKEFINAAPSDYCNAQLNTSDCAMRPIPVFTYYKPGSRCEIELWRGCTTLNKFEDEYECAHFCIGKLSPSFSAEVDNQILSAETNKTDCEIQINMEDCEKREYVFTYNNEMGQCQKVEWKGCETYNKFQNYNSCLEACGSFMKDSSAEKESKSDDSLQDEDESAAITLADALDEYGGDESPFSVNSNDIEEEETNDSQDGGGDSKNKDEKSYDEEGE